MTTRRIRPESSTSLTQDSALWLLIHHSQTKETTNNQRNNNMSVASSSATMTPESLTYEATKALQSTEHQPDRIHWDGASAFRDCPYRQLHHQRGVIGTFRVRLLEGRDLKRSYWSALALGPVKHLGWSTAHGPVSSFCCFQLDCVEDSEYGYEYDAEYAVREYGSHQTVKAAATIPIDDGDRKPSARRPSHRWSRRGYTAPSPVVPRNNHPVWENCHYDLTLRKGWMQPHDGMRIVLHVRVEEDKTAVEQWWPVGTSVGGGGSGLMDGGGGGGGGDGGGDNARLLGIGTCDVTDLCLGATATGQALPGGILDTWINLSLPRHKDEKDEQQQQQQQQLYRPFQHQQQQPLDGVAGLAMYNPDDPLAPPPQPCSATATSTSTSSDQQGSTGRVRVLVSYQPYGLEPQPKDIVALECFARRHPAHASCRPLLPPLLPLTVLERRGAYLLAEYTLPAAVSGTSYPHKNKPNKACVRLHRNAVFVIERQNIVDAAHNLALLPLDVVLSTPLGQATVHTLAPLVAAGKELLMPALLSLKLVWVAARTTTLAGVSGVQALGGTLWHEGTSSLTASHQPNLWYDHTGSSGSNRHPPAGRRTDAMLRRDSSHASAQFVSL